MWDSWLIVSIYHHFLMSSLIAWWRKNSSKTIPNLSAKTNHPSTSTISHIELDYVKIMWLLDSSVHLYDLRRRFKYTYLIYTWYWIRWVGMWVCGYVCIKWIRSHISINTINRHIYSNEFKRHTVGALLHFGSFLFSMYWISHLFACK